MTDAVAFDAELDASGLNCPLPLLKAKLELKKPVFTNVEKLIFAAVVVGALVAAYGLYDGFLTL